MSKKIWPIIGLVVATGAIVVLALSMKKKNALRETWMQYGAQFSFDEWRQMTDAQRQIVMAAQSEAPNGAPILATPPIVPGQASPFDFSKVSKVISDLFARKPQKQNA